MKYILPIIGFTVVGLVYWLSRMPNIHTPEPKLKTIHIVVGKDTVKISGKRIDVSSVHCSSGHNDWENGITTIEICKSDSPINKTRLPRFK